MSTTKLTLSVDSEVVQEAKGVAAGWHTSVSAIFSRVLRALTSPQATELESSPVTRRASGLVDIPEDISDRDLLSDALSSRYRTRK
jgi:hypothetical protein